MHLSSPTAVVVPFPRWVYKAVFVATSSSFPPLIPKPLSFWLLLKVLTTVHQANQLHVFVSKGAQSSTRLYCFFGVQMHHYGRVKDTVSEPFHPSGILGGRTIVQIAPPVEHLMCMIQNCATTQKTKVWPVLKFKM